MTKQQKITRRDKIEFVAYLEQCTPAQRQGVLEKEKAAGRATYVRLTEEAIARLD